MPRQLTFSSSDGNKKAMLSARILLYRNAMEPLAAEEVERQLRNLPPQIANSIEPSEAIAYALNRLPTLYATSLEGWYWQQQRAKETFGDLITKAASWGLKAVQRKSTRSSTPLTERELSTNDNIICKVSHLSPINSLHF